MTLSPGTPVWWNGRACVVVQVTGADTACPVVRVRKDNGRERTVRADRLRPRVTADTPTDKAHTPSRVFRSGTAERPVEVVSQPKPPKRWESSRYLAFVRQHPCCVCGATESIEAHHYDPGGSGMGRKADDTATAPLCTWHHREWHDTGRFASHGHTRAYSEWLQRDAQRRLLAAWVQGQRRTG